MIRKAEFTKPINEVIIDLCSQIEEWIKQVDKQGCVIGLSGGIDSTVVAYLCHKVTCNKLDWTTRVLFMPSLVTSKESLNNIEKIVFDLDVRYERIPVHSTINTIEAWLPFELNDYDLGNLQSEIRAVLLSRYAAKHNLLVMGTGNHDEDTVLGYFTKRGDGAVDNNILGNIPKRLVYELAKELEIPEEIINRKPTAELWEGQTDEEELGFSYEIAELVYNGVELNLSNEEIAKELSIDLSIVHKIISMGLDNKHKSQLPPIGKVELIYE